MLVARVVVSVAGKGTEGDMAGEPLNAAFCAEKSHFVNKNTVLYTENRV